VSHCEVRPVAVMMLPKHQNTVRCALAVLVLTVIGCSTHPPTAAADDNDKSDGVCSVDSETAAVKCVNRSLVNVPASLPASTTTLNLSYNLITRLTAQHISHLAQIVLISLQNNMLTDISNDAFVNCPSLHSLFLDHNVLSSMSFVNRTSLQELHISHNSIAVLEMGNITLSLTTVDLSFNSLHQFHSSCLSVFQNVRMLNLSHNLIETVILDDPTVLSLSHVNHLDVSSNRLVMLTLCSECVFYTLEYLDMSDNHLHSVDSSWCRLLPKLTVLIVSQNPIINVVSGSFRHCLSLHTLHMSNMLIKQISSGMLSGLTRLRSLRLDHNKHLVSVHQLSFQHLHELIELDLTGCSLTTIEPQTFLSSLMSLAVVKLVGNPWHCDCAAAVVRELSLLSARGVYISDDSLCTYPPSVRGKYILNVSDECHTARRQSTLRQTVVAHVGTELLVDCNTTTSTGDDYDDDVNVTWYWKHSGKLVPVTNAHTGRALYIASVSRATAGLYYCIVSNQYGTGTMLLSVRLNSDIISTTTLHSIIIGLLSSAGFFLVAVVIGIVRYLAYLCSTKERRKRKSIRAVLESIQDYKSAQFDRFSAYRTAKMDQLSAFKSAKIEQLSAFRDARVDKLRTYKQATVASILTHIERMREYYTAQRARIKDNCALQAEHLRERYTARCGRFKNYRSHQVDKMRENYAVQAARIREYGIIQMSRLREQYKTQQQHVLKLVELLDVGSCVSGVIEAECMKAESMIFDADIAFDFEAQPAHANESLMTSEGSFHYGTASDSDLSVSSDDYSHSVTAYLADVNDDLLKQREQDSTSLVQVENNGECMELQQTADDNDDVDDDDREVHDTSC